MKFRQFVRILHEHGFQVVRQKGSHRTYRGTVDGKIRQVQVAVHRDSDDVKPGTLSSMIRQSALPKHTFRH